MCPVWVGRVTLSIADSRHARLPNRISSLGTFRSSDVSHVTEKYDVKSRNYKEEVKEI